MKRYLSTSIRLTLTLIFIICIMYFSIVTLIGKAANGNGGGEKVTVNGTVVGYKLLGQKFTKDEYFWGRPSAVGYNAGGSGGSNLGPSNPAYLKIVQDRIDSFLVHNPGVTREQIPSEMVTASGSGLDPHISPASAKIQVKRVATVRHLSEEALYSLIDLHTQKPLFGPEVVHVLELNIALNELK